MPRDPAQIPGRVLMGRIGTAHGIRGEVRIEAFTADPLSIATWSPLLTDRPGLTVSIAKSRLQKGLVIASLIGVADRNEAEALNGVALYVAREKLPASGKDEFYHADLIGLEARTRDGAKLGRVAAVHNYGAGDNLEIAPKDAASFLIPFTRLTVPEIRLAENYLLVDLPPGLLDEEKEGAESQ
ncbi:MAG: ribosome maturation factor RimM [Cucumibacter sp.]